MAGCGVVGKIRELSILKNVVHNLQAELVVLPEERLDDHCCDALVSAAALRYYALATKYWRPAAMTAAARRHEGWIFGLT